MQEKQFWSREGYELEWSDEFEGDSLNRHDWNVELHEPGWVNEELQEYIDSEENIQVRDGKLIISPVKKADDLGNVKYYSGRVNTQNKHDFKYGLFEAKMRVPRGKGFLPAFWMMPTDEYLYGQWPRCGEIDIMEVMGQNTQKAMGTIHYGNPHEQNQGEYEVSESDFCNQWHTFSVEWEPGKIVWYIDETKYHEVREWYSASEKGKISYPAPFDQKFYIIFNLAIGGSWVGYPDETTTYEDQSLMVDYVRVYRKSQEYYDMAEQNLRK
ncbi:MAG: glycoside hydrolase family 16 protein [Lachnospiraceae bacterium]|nr:glycoside hydrolase family 16 protein [Lachnospiraceae bacterium]MDD6505709.1 glycoside hydrolase family 16 protein [Lachnospiraceae bacterium]